jgi:hypothetical protein
LAQNEETPQSGDGRSKTKARHDESSMQWTYGERNNGIADIKLGIYPPFD